MTLRSILRDKTSILKLEDDNILQFFKYPEV